MGTRNLYQFSPKSGRPVRVLPSLEDVKTGRPMTKEYIDMVVANTTGYVNVTVKDSEDGTDNDGYVEIDDFRKNVVATQDGIRPKALVDPGKEIEKKVAGEIKDKPPLPMVRDRSGPTIWQRLAIRLAAVEERLDAAPCAKVNWWIWLTIIVILLIIVIILSSMGFKN